MEVRVKEAETSGSLDLSKLSLMEFPDRILDLGVRLRHLDLSSTHLTAFPKAFSAKLSALLELRISNNQLDAIAPELLEGLSLLEVFVSNKNNTTMLPVELCRLETLTYVSVERNRLTRLPPDVGLLTNLTELHLKDNELTNLPNSIGNMAKLKVLDVSHNGLVALPETVGRLTHIVMLDASHNALSALPSSLVRLNEMATLNVEKNEIKYLPPELGRLRKLNSLNVSRNPITEIPPTYAMLTELINLVCTDCPLVFPLPQTVLRGTRDVVFALRERLVSEGYVSNICVGAHVMVMGDTGVGKTALARSLCRTEKWTRWKTFDVKKSDEVEAADIAIHRPGMDMTSHSMVVNFTPRATCPLTVSLPVTEFSGDTNALSAQSFFITDNGIAIICFSLLDTSDFVLANIEHNILRVYAHAPHTHIFVVGTHRDDPRFTSDDRSSSDKAVKYVLDVVREYLGPAKSKHVKGFFGVSGTNPDPGQKGGNISMDEVRTSVLNALFELDDTCRGLFKEYNAFRNSLKSLASDAQIPVIDYDRFRGYVSRMLLNGTDSATVTNELLKYMRQQRELLYFEHDPELSTFVFLKPEWWARELSYLCTSKAKKGMHLQADLARNAGGVWASKERDILLSMEDLLHRFNFTTTVAPKKGRSELVFALLPEGEPGVDRWPVEKKVNEHEACVVFTMWTPPGLFSQVLCLLRQEEDLRGGGGGKGFLCRNHAVFVFHEDDAKELHVRASCTRENIAITVRGTNTSVTAEALKSAIVCLLRAHYPGVAYVVRSSEGEEVFDPALVVDSAVKPPLIV